MSDHARYDGAYFDHWYRREGFGSPARLERKARYAVGAAEYLLDRPVRSVLDVGAGEGAWHGAVQRLRPAARYVGVDPSEYAVARYGRRRNLVLGALGDLARLASEGALRGPFDLIVCIDVLAYPGDDEVAAGLQAIADLLGGVALLEVYTADDTIVGDTDHYRLRPTADYERWTAAAGLTRVGPHLYVGDRLRPTLGALER